MSKKFQQTLKEVFESAIVLLEQKEGTAPLTVNDAKCIIEIFRAAVQGEETIEVDETGNIVG